MPRYKLRTLLILLAVLPPVLAGAWFVGPLAVHCLSIVARLFIDPLRGLRGGAPPDSLAADLDAIWRLVIYLIGPAICLAVYSLLIWKWWRDLRSADELQPTHNRP